MLSPQLTLAILKPSLCSSLIDTQEVLRLIKRSGFEIVRSKKLFWKERDAQEFYAEHKGKFFYDRLVQHASSGTFTALALYAPESISKWRNMIGGHVYKAQWENPDSLRAKYGISDTRNAFHGSDGPEAAIKELGQVFEGWDVRWWLEQRAKEDAGQN